MAERRIAPAPNNGRRFTISTDPDLFNDYPDQAEVIVLLSPELVAEHEVYSKPIPASLKGMEYNGKKIRWMNNFGLKKKNSPGFEGKTSRYEVQLKHVKDAEYVYFDGSVVNLLPVSAPKAGKVTAQLDLGDPPVGWVK